jgi:hypothetical protein
MGRTACTEPQCLYKGALYLLSFDEEAVWETALTWQVSGIEPKFLGLSRLYTPQYTKYSVPVHMIIFLKINTRKCCK